MIRKFKVLPSCALLGALCLGPAFAASAGAAQSQIVLKVSSFLPPMASINVDVVKPWIKKLEKDTHGKVTVRFYTASSPFGNILNQEDQVRSGVVDAAVGLCTIPRGRFPRTSIMELPFMTDDAGVATRTLWSLYKEGYLKPEYRPFKVLALFGDEGGWIHTHSKPIRTLADMKGLRFRSPSTIASASLQQLGATPVGMPPSQIYVNLERGTLDGTALEWDGVEAFHLNDVLKYHTDMPVYRDVFFFLMSRRKYDALPPDVRSAIDAISGANLEPKFGALWKRWDRTARLDAKKRGEPLIYLSAAEKAKWRAALQPVTTHWLRRLESHGVSNAQAIYTRARALVKQYSAN